MTTVNRSDTHRERTTAQSYKLLLFNSSTVRRVLTCVCLLTSLFRAQIVALFHFLNGLRSNRLTQYVTIDDESFNMNVHVEQST